MKTSEFYHQITHINFAESDLKTCCQAIIEELLNTPPQNISWELFIEVLRRATKRAQDKTLIINELPEFNQEDILQQADLLMLLNFLKSLIRMIEEDGIPTNSYNGIIDSYFNWNIHIILERGAAWLTDCGESEEELELNPTWADLLFLIKMGREYE
jgi:hypothetical protein